MAAGLGAVNEPQPGAIGLAAQNLPRTPVLSADPVELSARFSNLIVGSGVSIANFITASIICW